MGRSSAGDGAVRTDETTNLDREEKLVKIASLE